MLLGHLAKQPHQGLDSRLLKMVRLLDSLQFKIPIHLVDPLRALELRSKVERQVGLASHQVWAKSQVHLALPPLDNLRC